MGPRSADRGIEPLAEGAYCATRQLQWGRDQLIAELVLESLGHVDNKELQWGRDQLIAELADRDTSAPPGLGASMGPRSADRGIQGARLRSVR